MPTDNKAGHTYISARFVLKRISTNLLLLASLAGFGFSSVAQAQVDEIESLNSGCGADFQGQNYKGCTAGEISISMVSSVVFQGRPAGCVIGHPLTLSSVTVDYTINVGGHRADLVLWVGDQEGTDPRLAIGPGNTCSAYSLPFPFNPTPDVTNPFGNQPGDDDQCGDLAFLVNQASRTFSKVNFECQDNDGDGFADIQVLLTWSSDVNQACGLGAGQSFPTVGSVSKCDFQVINFELPVVIMKDGFEEPR